MPGAIDPADASNGVSLRGLCVGLGNCVESRTACIDLTADLVRLGDDHHQRCAYFRGQTLVQTVGKVCMQFVIRYHIDEAIRKWWVTKSPRFLFQLEVRVHGKVKCVQPTLKYINSVLRQGIINRSYLFRDGVTRFFPGIGQAGHSTHNDPGLRPLKPSTV